MVEEELDFSRPESEQGESPVDYLAFGSGRARRTFAKRKGIAHDPGSVQGNHPREAGPRGATFVNIEADGTVSCDFVPTASVALGTVFDSARRGGEPFRFIAPLPPVAAREAGRDKRERLDCRVGAPRQCGHARPLRRGRVSAVCSRVERSRTAPRGRGDCAQRRAACRLGDAAVAPGRKSVVRRLHRGRSPLAIATFPPPSRPWWPSWPVRTVIGPAPGPPGWRRWPRTATRPPSARHAQRLGRKLFHKSVGERAAGEGASA